MQNQSSATSLRDLYPDFPLKRTVQDLEGPDYEAFCKPRLTKVLTEADFQKFGGNSPLPAPPSHTPSKLRIVTAQYNFDRDKVVQDYQRMHQEAEFVEQQLAREKAILREAYIRRQRQQLKPESSSGFFFNN